MTKYMGSINKELGDLIDEYTWKLINLSEEIATLPDGNYKSILIGKYHATSDVVADLKKKL